jgi:hypothetical protein
LYPVVNYIAKRIWGSYGLSEVVWANTFDFVDHATNVLDRALWHMANRPLVLKHWQPNMQFLKDDLARVLVWVKLYNVPLHADLTTMLRKRLCESLC